MTLAARAWRAEPDDPELHREIVGAETREELLNNPAALCVASTWEVLGERISTRRDGLVSIATWLMNLWPQGPRFAVLLDVFPASAGRRSGAFAFGHRFAAELVFYPARTPLRAVVAARSEAGEVEGGPWPAAPRLSARVAGLGVPVFACTPDQFPDLMAAALKREDLNAWAAKLDIKAVRAD